MISVEDTPMRLAEKSSVPNEVAALEKSHKPNGLLPPVPHNQQTPSVVSVIMNPPTYIVKERLKFLILDAPHYENIHCYIQELQRFSVSDLVRTCERTYDENVVRRSGIVPHALVFPDGDPPSNLIIEEWLEVVADSAKKNTAVGVHCLAGLGRAPVLVVIALIEKASMRNVDAIELVRSQRRGAINKRQLEYLMAYRKQRRPAPGRWCCGGTS